MAFELSQRESVPTTPCIPPSLQTYNQDGLISMHDCSFQYEPVFAAAYRQAERTGSWTGPWGQAKIHWRAHVLCWAGQLAKALDGDFVECGVDRGGTAMLLLQYLSLDIAGRAMYLYDTFCGLDPHRSSDNELKNTDGVYSDCFEAVRERFAPYPNVFLRRGSIPDTFAQPAPERVAYLHIDMNAVEPEQAAMNFFWPRLVEGGVVVMDDYAWIACGAQKRAMDMFSLRVKCPILSLPTGQGLLIKTAEKTHERG